MSPQGRRLIPLLAAAACLPATAWAHTGIGTAAGFGHGFLHPIGGIDHILAMVAVGLFAATLGGRALRAVPLAFMVLMAIGGAWGIAGFALPHAETGITLSVIVLGLAITFHGRWSVAAASTLAGAFAVFHGHAHGVEMPESLSAAGYALGFLLATGMLHLAGIAVGVAPARFGQASARRLAQAGGVAIAVAGGGLLVGLA